MIAREKGYHGSTYLAATVTGKERVDTQFDKAGDLVREVAGAGQDIRLDYDRKSDTSATVEASRNFANKLWNATRFALRRIDPSREAGNVVDIATRPFADRWIIAPGNTAARERLQNRALEQGVLRSGHALEVALGIGSAARGRVVE